MQILRKYSFANEAKWLEAKAQIRTTSESLDGEQLESYNANVSSVSVIGHIVETPAVINEDGEVSQEAILSSTYHIDIIWNGEPMFTDNIIWCPPMGVLVSGGIDTRTEWIEKCKELHPEYFPEPSEEI